MKSLYALRFTLHTPRFTLLTFHSTPLALRRGVGGEAFHFSLSIGSFVSASNTTSLPSGYFLV